MSIIVHLRRNGIYNFALVSEDDSDVYAFTFQSFTFETVVHYNSKSNGHDLFPDKLKDLTGIDYRTLACYQKPWVDIIDGEVRGLMLHFLRTVAKIQNAGIHITLLNRCSDVALYWHKRKMDITINMAVVFDTPAIPKLMSYEVGGHCALIPKPQKTSLFQLIIVEPFDGLTWMFLILTMASSVGVWWMFRGRGAFDSPWLLAYGMLVMFVGQGVDFSRRNRLVLTILLQLIIVMIWVLCNAYEGVITSFMIQPIQEQKLETFDDLISSNLEIMTDSVFEHWTKESDEYEKLKSRLCVTSHIHWDELSSEIRKAKKAIIYDCDQVKFIMTLTLPNGNKVSDHYYMLSNFITSYLLRFEASYLNPFIERLQRYMDLSFQAGLPYIWKVYENQDDKRSSSHILTSNETYLKLSDFYQVFIILLVGLLCSFAVFIVEKCLRSFIEKIKISIMARELRTQVNKKAYKKRKQPKHPKYQKGALYYIIHRRKRVKRLKSKKLKVRRIYVQPRFRVD